jgi:ABC-type transport system involved in multi-copper enzyme maturation permease subunit
MDARSTRWTDRFFAIVKYELLWNIRKKKFLSMIIVAFVLATVVLALPVILSNVANISLKENPDFVVGSAGGGVSGSSLISFLFALVTVMNSISGEFESGTIVPLLTKPVSRTMVFFGKLFAAFLTLLASYTVLYVYVAIGGTIVYGPQNNLPLIPIHIFGNILSTFVWVSIVLAIGSLSKSSIITAVGAVAIFLALFIGAPIVSLFSEQAWVLTYVPGSGASGYIKGLGAQTALVPGMSVSTGTDSIGVNLVTCILHPSANVTFYSISTLTRGTPLSLSELYTEPLSLVLLRSLFVATTYICVFTFIAWYTFRRAQVLE